MKAIFSPALRRRTILNSIYLLISMTGLWAGSVYVPSSVTQIATRAGGNAVSAAHLASWATMLLSACTILGCLMMAPLAERIGRRAGVVPALSRVAGLRRGELCRLYAVAA